MSDFNAQGKKNKNLHHLFGQTFYSRVLFKANTRQIFVFFSFLSASLSLNPHSRLLLKPRNYCSFYPEQCLQCDSPYLEQSFTSCSHFRLVHNYLCSPNQMLPAFSSKPNQTVSLRHIKVQYFLTTFLIFVWVLAI